MTPLQHLGVCVRHSITTGKRNVALQLSDKRSLLVAAIQPVLVAFLIVILFGTISGLLTAMYSQQVLFLLGITAFWLGCNNAAKEIVKERSLFEKERNAGLDAVGYLMSKFVLLSLFTAVQSTLLLWIVAIGTGLQGSMIVYSVSLFLAGVCGVSLGLAISALASNSDVAATAVPLAVIPQVILAGAIRPVEGIAEWVSAFFVPCYWCFGMLSKSFANASDFLLTDPMSSQRNLAFSFMVVTLFTALFLLAAASTVLGRNPLNRPSS